MSEALDRLLRGTVHVHSREELEGKLALGRPLRVKLGVDPTSPDLHLGHTVVLTKLRQFQDLGHRAVLIIGDFTARIGDPSGRSEARPPLAEADVERNAATYQEQAFKILSRESAEVHRNGRWLTPLFGEFSAGGGVLGRLLARTTVQQLTKREDFARRLSEGRPLTVLELLYPLLQGYDSAAPEIQADVEIGGTDQLFNLLMGREIQEALDRPPQVALTLPLLEGTDGVKKMSKSFGNAVALNDPPEEMFGKIMSLSDGLMARYYELLLGEGVPGGHPMESKKALAERITGRYHGTAAAKEARARFEAVFSRGSVPDKLQEHRASRSPIRACELLMEAGLAPSKNEARRLIAQGAVEWGGERLTEDRDLALSSPIVARVGKRQFRSILPPEPGR